MIFFVMLRCQNGKDVLPLVTGDYGETVALYDTAEKARSAGRENPLGEAYGFDVFEVGCGV